LVTGADCSKPVHHATLRPSSPPLSVVDSGSMQTFARTAALLLKGPRVISAMLILAQFELADLVSVHFVGTIGET
jgi:hypothetical protein